MFSTGRSRLLLVVGIVVIAAVGFGGWYVFIRDDAPAEVSLRECDESGGSNDAEVSIDELQGTWAVVNGNGSPEEGTGTFAGYRIQEELASIGGNTAVGRTGDVTGGLTVDGEQVTEASFEVDMTTLQSDESRRDDRLRTEGLQTDTFPTSTFSVAEPVDIPANAVACNFRAAGELDLHGVTQPVTVDLDATMDGDQVTVVGSAPVALADYDIEPPTGGPILSIEDNGTFEFQMVLTRDGASGGSGGSEPSGGDTESTEATTETTESTEETTETTSGGY